jgi:hypothetical protein
MTSRHSLLLYSAAPLLALGILFACLGPARDQSAAASADPFSGIYDMKGMTTDLKSGD